MLLMETAICDSKLSQLTFSTTSAHSANAQPSLIEKKSSFGGRKRLRQKNYQDSDYLNHEFENLRIVIFILAKTGILS